MNLHLDKLTIKGTKGGRCELEGITLENCPDDLFLQFVRFIETDKNSGPAAILERAAQIFNMAEHAKSQIAATKAAAENAIKKAEKYAKKVAKNEEED